MKNLVRLMILVVVALISGFPQVNGQGNKTCYKIRIKYYYSDSSYWNVDTNVLKDYTLKLEQVLNNATGLNKGFILEYAGLVKIVDKIWFKWDTKMSQGAQGARMALYLDHFEKDTTILPIYLGNQRMFTITYPSNEYNWTLCNPVMGYPNFKSNVVLLVRNDSLLNYNVPFYINVGARGILTKMNIGKYPIDGYIMSNNIWLITNIWDPASISGMNVITPTCIPIVSEKCGITNLQNVGIVVMILILLMELS